MNQLILASASPRREQLIAYLGVPYIVKPSPLDEKSLRLSGSPPRQAMDCAKAKAQAAAQVDGDNWILAADTIVCIGDRILGKPASRNDAFRMLSLLSGQVHTVITGLCLMHAAKDSPAPVYEETRVWMAALSDAQIEAYIDTGEPADKAGAYGIQGYGGAMIPRVEGCYFNVMGLPLYRSAKLLEEAHIGPGAPYWKEGRHD